MWVWGPGVPVQGGMAVGVLRECAPAEAIHAQVLTCSAYPLVQVLTCSGAQCAYVFCDSCITCIEGNQGLALAHADTWRCYLCRPSLHAHAGPAQGSARDAASLTQCCKLNGAMCAGLATVCVLCAGLSLSCAVKDTGLCSSFSVPA